jgi:hypothetical protein
LSSVFTSKTNPFPSGLPILPRAGHAAVLPCENNCPHPVDVPIFVVIPEPLAPPVAEINFFAVEGVELFVDMADTVKAVTIFYYHLLSSRICFSVLLNFHQTKRA